MTTPSREIELKFLLDAAAAEAVLAALPPGEPVVTDLVATYFDTPDHWLRQNGFGLRVRRSGKERIQTLKAALGADGGRDEWEWPVKSDVPDLALLLATPAPVTADTELIPRFTVRTRRTIRRIRQGDSDIELALDDAEVTAGDRRDAFVELELEFKSGPPSALFDLARELAAIAPLRLSSVTKAERGFALVDGVDRGRPRYAGPRLTADLTAARAFQTLGAACLAHLCANAESLRDMPGPEGVHQLRVAVRRLRAGLATFKPLIAVDEREAMKQSLRWLAGELDEARNLDVFIADFWRPAARDHHDLPGMAAFGRALLTAQTRAYERAAKAIDSPRFRTLTLETAAWLRTGPWTADEATATARGGPAPEFAADALKRRRKKILKAGKRLADLDRPTRHRVRIQAKILRYAAEDLGGLFPDHPRRAERFVESLKALQDALGALNDLAFGEDLARGVALASDSADAAFAVGRLTGERASDEAALLKAAEEAFKDFTEARPFW